jgi:hypothetical protein
LGYNFILSVVVPFIIGIVYRGYGYGDGDGSVVVPFIIGIVYRVSGKKLSIG